MLHSSEKIKQYIRDHYQTKTDQEIAYDLDCGLSKIQHTRRKLGLKKSGARSRYPIGTIRIHNMKNYQLQKIKTETGWVSLHKLNWEKENGPLPPGHNLFCIDGNHLNADASNWKIKIRSKELAGSGARVGHNHGAPNYLNFFR